MATKLKNLDIATAKMEKDHVWMYAFDFEYNKVHTYTFLFRIPINNKDTFAVSFADKTDTSRTLSCPINNDKIETSVSAIFRFFRINNGFDDRSHMLELMSALYGNLNAALLSAGIPNGVQNVVAIRENSSHSSGDGIYLCGLRRTGHRTEQNTTKAKKYCKEAFDIFGIDPGLSFCFSEDPTKQASTKQLCERLARLRGI